MARSKPGSPYALKWAAVFDEIRAQNPEKSVSEILKIARTVELEFSKNWQTYKYTKKE